jgi:alanyl-tRNA synthetase
LVKVLKTERLNEKTRVFFVAGLQAFELFRQMYEAFNGLANQMSTSWQEVPDVITRQVEQLSGAQKELQALRQAAIKLEARELASMAQERDGVKHITESFRGRPVPELRLLAEELKRVTGVVAFLSSYDGVKLSLIVTCGEGSDKDARQLLAQTLSQISGRGGGDARLAQGGGTATEDEYRLFLEAVAVKK